MSASILFFLWISCAQKVPIDPTQSLDESLALLNNLQVLPSTVVAGNSALVKVQLLDQNNNPITGEEIHFIVNTNAVTFSTTPVQTDAEGWASTYLESSQDARNAIVTARYGNYTRSTTVNFIAAQSSNIQIETEQTTLLADGLDQTTIMVTVFNDSARPVYNTGVTFNTTAGTITPAAATNSEGKAYVTLTSASSTENVTAVVTARHETDSAAVSVIFKGVTLDVWADPNAILADGQSTSKIQTRVKETQTNVVITDAPVRFETDTGTLLNGIVQTDENGVAEATLVSRNVPDTAQVVAFFGPVLNKSVTVIFQESIAGYLKVTANPEAILANGQTQSTIRARVTDQNQLPVAGVVVRFAFADKPAGEDWGTMSPEYVTTNLNGESSTMLTSSDSIKTVTVRASCTVNTQEGQVVLADTAEITYLPGEAQSINLAIFRYDPNTQTYIPAESVQGDGIDQRKVRATVKDDFGHGLRNIPVHFYTTLGDITPTSDTNDQGVAEATFSSGAVGVATITATVTNDGKTLSRTTTIRALPGDPHSIVLSFDPRAIGVKGTGQNQTATIQAEVRDAKNNPVVDSTLVRFSIVHQPGGVTLSSYDNIPTVGGIARVSISSGTVSGNVRIRTEVIDAEDQSVVLAAASEILVHAGPPYMEDRTKYYSTHLTIVADELNIWRGLGTTTLSIAVFDKYHNPVQQNTAVYVTASGGGVSTHTAFTDDQGKAQVILTGGNPQPLIHKFYHGELMQDPNDSSIVLPGPIYYPDLDQRLIPNFDGDFTWNYPATLNGLIPNTMDDSLDTCPRYTLYTELYRNLENDGVARIIAYTEGVDADGDSVRAWDQIAVVYSGGVGYWDNSGSVFTTPDAFLYIGESRTITFTLMDDNGNPIESNSTIKASLTSEKTASLDWNERNTGDGWGTCYYTITISNDVDPENADKAKTGWVAIKIEWDNENQFGDATTWQIYISAADRTTP